MISPPHGYAEVVATFGDPAQFRLPDGTLSREWEARKIARVVLPRPMAYSGGGVVTKWAVHILLVPTVMALVRELDAAGYLADESDLAPYGGGFEPRMKRGVAQLSLHTFGAALDFNPEKYPLGSTARMPQPIVDLFAKYGFMYGGDFHGRTDPMHFQFATGC